MKQKFITRGAYRYYVTAKVYDEKADGDEVYEIKETLVLSNKVDTNSSKELLDLKLIIARKRDVTVLKADVTGVIPIQLRVPFEDFVAAAVKYEREKEAFKDAENYGGIADD